MASTRPPMESRDPRTPLPDAEARARQPMVLTGLSVGSPTDTQDIFESSKRLADAIKYWLDSHEELYPDAAELGRRGWTVPVWSSTIAVREIVSQTTPDTVDRWFLDVYAARLRKEQRALFRSLRDSEFLTPWHPLLVQCIAAYQRNHLLVPVPALLGILEGAVASAAGQLVRGPNIRNHVAGLKAANSGIVGLALVSLDAFVAEVFRTERFAAQPSRMLSRHVVMHGRGLPVSPRADCLRLFQSLQTLSEIASLIQSRI